MGLRIWWKKLFGIQLTAEERLHAYPGPVTVLVPKPVGAVPGPSPKPMPPLPISPPTQGAPMQKMSDAGFVQTKYCEGLSLISYQDSGGTWTIGYGRILYDNGTRVAANQVCTLEEAELWLQEDAEKDGAHFVRAWCSGLNLSQNQFDALADFSFNAGAGNLHKLLSMSGNLADNIPIADPNKLLGRQRRRKMNRAMYLGLPWEEFKEWQPT